MKEFILYRLLPFLLLVLFGLIMISGDYLKQPLSREDDVMHYLDAAIKSVEAENWDDATHSLSHVNRSFQPVIKRIQFSVERNEINQFTLCIERTKGFIQGHEKSGALAELEEAHYLWDELGK
ncbi:DUF4363 family protein [Bacillus tuaregi]|uniref:DUF4363 family protein n=1 Tax=Bacillus tuaregi TaxID=1816695 RepID=UPI0008F92690|nr:DUF4363 family protein [Bacillus tuaregi]